MNLTGNVVVVFGKEPDPSVGPGYSSAQILFAAIEKAGTLDRTAIRDAIRETDMMTVSGPIKFDEKGIPIGKVLVNIQYFHEVTLRINFFN